MSGSGGYQGGYSGSATGHEGSASGGPRRTFEERAAAKDAMMQSLRDSSQQDRRVYVGNLSYDVKWHHLKDFMRQGNEAPAPARLSRTRQFLHVSIGWLPDGCLDGR